MKRPIFLLLILALLWEGVDLSQRGQAQAQPSSESDAPYLYYYSDYHNAFVIERADGTDTRLLGAANGPHPSGIYWTSISGQGWSADGQWFLYFIDNQGYQTLQVMRVDGSRLSSTDAIEEKIIGAYWSPDGKNLLVRSEDEYGLIHLYIVDTVQDQIIYIWQAPDTPYEVYPFMWHPDGQSIHFYVEAHKYSYEDITLLTLYLDGREVSRTVQSVIRGEYGDTPTERPIITPDNRLAYITSSEPPTLVLEDISTNQTELLPLSGSIAYFMESSDDNRYHLLVTCQACDRWIYTDLKDQLWLWDSQKQSLEQVYKGILYYHEWRDGQFIITNDNNEWFSITPHSTPLQVNPLRNPYLAIRNQQDAHHPYIIETWTQTVIRNIPNRQSILIPPHSARSSVSDQGGEFEWHPEQDWFISWENDTRSGGGSPRNVLGRVIKADGAIYRDFGNRCSGNCGGWLPPQVDISQLPPPMDSDLGRLIPQQIWQTTGWVGNFSWSPDSQQLLSGDIGSAWAWGDVWDINTRQLRYEVTYTYNDIPEWQPNADGSYQISFQEQAIIDTTQKVAATSPDGRFYIARGKDDPSVPMIFDAVTQTALLQLQGAEEFHHPHFSYSPDGRWIAGGSHDGGRLTFWDAATGEYLYTFDLFAGGVAFSPDGQWLAVGVGWDIHLYAVSDILAQLPQ